MLSMCQADDIQTSMGGSTKPSDTGSAIVANLADLTKLGASETRLHLTNSAAVFSADVSPKHFKL